MDVAELTRQARHLPRSHGGPVWRLHFKRQAQDFQVDEVLGFELSGSGEHLWLLVRKVGINTADVVRRLSSAAGIAPRHIGIAGLKDRHGVCRQWLSLHLPGRCGDELPPALSSGHSWADAALSIEQAGWNHRKLKRGNHRGNRFCVRLYADQPFSPDDRAAIAQRLDVIGRQGVPNYFGEQRFGFDNLAKAMRLFSGQASRQAAEQALPPLSDREPRMSRNERSLVLSAARSALFNAVLARRVIDGTWSRYIDGDVLNLDGTGSVFVPETCDQTLLDRLASGDIHPTGPMWGKGEPLSRQQARALEDAVLHDWQLFREGLEHAGLEQQRRSLRLPVQALNYRFFQDTALVQDGVTDPAENSPGSSGLDTHTGLELVFTLPTGSYATAVLHELADVYQADRTSARGIDSIS